MLVKKTALLCLLFVAIFASCVKENVSTNSLIIKIDVKSENFYKGSIIPMRIEMTNPPASFSNIQLLIDDSIVFEESPSVKYYWNTQFSNLGLHKIEAFLSTDKSLNNEIEILIEETETECSDGIVDIDGNEYNIVQIGNQCWMQSNLLSTHYADGTPLLNGIDSLVGGLPNELPGWYFAYNNNINNVATYGLLYTWTTAMKGNKAFLEGEDPIQGICPDGWHMPSVNEWRTLIDFLGGPEVAANKLKDEQSGLWINNLPSTDNYSNFSSLPGGCRTSFGSAFGGEFESYHWSSTETIINHAYHLYLKNTDATAFLPGHIDSKRFAYSVRCIKD